MNQQGGMGLQNNQYQMNQQLQLNNQMGQQQQQFNNQLQYNSNQMGQPQQFNNQLQYNNNNNMGQFNRGNQQQQSVPIQPLQPQKPQQQQQPQQQYYNNNNLYQQQQQPQQQQQQQPSNTSFDFNNSQMMQGFPSKLPSFSPQQQTSPQQQQQPNRTSDGKIPPISSESKAQYANYFYRIGGDNVHSISGQIVKPVFQKSGLSNQELGNVWMLADIDRDGTLDREEFALAMHLIYAIKNGYQLPNELPKYLIPEAKLIYNVSSANNVSDWQTFSFSLSSDQGSSGNVGYSSSFQQQQQQPQQKMPQQQQYQQQQQSIFFSNPNEFVPAPYTPNSNVSGSAITFEQRVALSSDLDAALAKRQNRF
eukprot:gene4956-6173_t